MALSSRDRVLYARHVLLPEIGSAGQELLCSTQVALSDHTDRKVAEVTEDYLARAGMTVSSAAATFADLTVDESMVTALAGTPELRHAAAALLGAFAATEVIKRVTGIGSTASFPAQLSFCSEDV